MKAIIKTLWNDLLNLFFPDVCLLCGKLLYQGEEHICLYCYCQLPKTGFYTHENNPAWQLFLGKVHIEKAWAFLYFEKGGFVQKLIHQLKYHNNKELAYWLGRLAAEEIVSSRNKYNFDLLVPVPLHPTAKKRRGYNQSEWIAKGISIVTGLPVRTDVLIKKVVTGSQTQHTVYDRWKNPTYRIRPLEKYATIFPVIQAEELQDKHILLIDDVLTTGSTTAACAETLLTISGTRISILTLTIA